MKNIHLGNKAYCKECPSRIKGTYNCKECGKECNVVTECPKKNFSNIYDYFPIILPYGNPERVDTRYFVPLSMVAEHQAQCLKNHCQTVKNLKERGGLDWTEMYAVLTDTLWEDSIHDEEHAKNLVIEFTEKWGKSENEYVVPVEWSMSGFVKIKAGSAEDAIRKVHENKDDISLPTENELISYIEGSFEVSGYDNLEECENMCKLATEEYKERKKNRRIHS